MTALKQYCANTATYSKESAAFGKKNTGKKIEGKLEMNTDAKPVAQKPRPVPYHLQKALKDWLDQGVKEEIFEKVPDGEAITWCSPLVVQPKPKFTEMRSEELESHIIRASIDMRIPDQSMKRGRCVQSPRVEDFIYRLQDCKIFTKLDLRQAYHQLALDKTSSNNPHTLGELQTPTIGVRGEILARCL